jgi:hypothetical protein
VTITRDTADGRLRLAMKFSRDTAEKDLTIQVQITNIWASTIAGLFYSRYVDFDCCEDGATTWDRAASSVWQGAGSGVGASASAITHEIPHTTEVERWYDLDRLGSAAGDSNTCAANVPLATPNLGDNSGRITYNLGNLAAGKSKIVKFVYRRQ